MADEHQFCTFHLADYYLGVDVMQVREVIRPQPMTRVPLAHHVVRGLINLRGQIVTALDLRRRLELPDRPDDRAPMNVVIDTADGAVSLLVDEIGDIRTVPGSAFERPPDTLAGAAHELVRGVYKLDGRLLLVLDAALAAAVPNGSQLQTHSPNEGHY